MPLTTVIPREISRVTANTWEIEGLAIDAKRDEIRAHYRLGLTQPDASVRWLREDENVSVSAAPYARRTVADLLAQMRLTPDATLRAFIKALSYMIAQDANAMPPGTIT